MRQFLVVLALLGLLLAFTGCAAPKVDANVQYVIEQVIAPAIQKGLAETSTRTATLQGGLQGINPKYKVDFQGLWVTGVIGSAAAGLDGVSGQITGHVQTDNDAEPKPAIRQDGADVPRDGTQ